MLNLKELLDTFSIDNLSKIGELEIYAQIEKCLLLSSETESEAENKLIDIIALDIKSHQGTDSLNKNTGIICRIICLLKNINQPKLFEKLCDILKTKNLSCDIQKVIEGRLISSSAILIPILGFERFLTDFPVREETVNYFEKVYEKINGQTSAELLYSHAFPFVFKTENEKLHDIAIKISLILSKFGKLSDLDSEKKRLFLISLEKEYITKIQINDANSNSKQSSNWHKMIILLLRFGGVCLHNRVDIINAALKIVEDGFKSSTYHKMCAYDCWMELIDNYSLNLNHMSTPKHIKLLITPLSANLSSHRVVTEKRFSLWVHLIKNLKDKGSLCLEKFMQFCFGPIKSRSILGKQINQQRKVTYVCDDSIKFLLEILGHSEHDPSDPCIECEKHLKLEIKLLNSSNFESLYPVIVHAIIESCLFISNWNNTKNAPKVVSCMWNSLLNLIDQLETEAKSRSLDLLQKEILALCKIAEENSSFEFVFYIIIEVIMNFQSKSEDDSLFRPLLTPSINSLSSSEKLDTHRLQKLINDAYFSKKRISKERMFCDLCVLLSEIENNKKVSSWLWNVLSQFVSDLLFNYVNAERLTGSLLKFMLWPLENYNSLPEEKKQNILNVWKTLIDEMFRCNGITIKNHENLVTTVIHAFQKLLKKNPILHYAMPNFLPLLPQEPLTKEHFDVLYISNLLQLLLDLLDCPLVSKQNMSKLEGVLSACINSILSNSNNKNDFIFENLFKAIQYFLQPHQMYEVLAKLELILCENFVSKTKVPPALRTLIMDLTMHKDSNISQSAMKVLPLLNESKADALLKPSDKCLEILNSKSSKKQKSPFFKNTQIIPQLIDQDNISPLKLKGSQLKSPSKPPTPSSTPKSNKQSSVSGETKEAYVLIESNYKFDKKKLTEHQKEVLKKRKEDIPALYQDLSQSQTDSQSNSQSNSMENKINTDLKITKMNETDQGTKTNNETPKKYKTNIMSNDFANKLKICDTKDKTSTTPNSKDNNQKLTSGGDDFISRPKRRSSIKKSDNLNPKQEDKTKRFTVVEEKKVEVNDKKLEELVNGDKVIAKINKTNDQPIKKQKMIRKFVTNDEKKIEKVSDKKSSDELKIENDREMTKNQNVIQKFLANDGTKTENIQLEKIYENKQLNKLLDDDDKVINNKTDINDKPTRKRKSENFITNQGKSKNKVETEKNDDKQVNESVDNCKSIKNNTKLNDKQTKKRKSEKNIKNQEKTTKNVETENIHANESIHDEKVVTKRLHQELKKLKMNIVGGEIDIDLSSKRKSRRRSKPKCDDLIYFYDSQNNSTSLNDEQLSNKKCSLSPNTVINSKKNENLSSSEHNDMNHQFSEDIIESSQDSFNSTTKLISALSSFDSSVDNEKRDSKEHQFLNNNEDSDEVVIGFCKKTPEEKIDEDKIYKNRELKNNDEFTIDENKKTDINSASIIISESFTPDTLLRTDLDQRQKEMTLREKEICEADTEPVNTANSENLNSTEKSNSTQDTVVEVINENTNKIAEIPLEIKVLPKETPSLLFDSEPHQEKQFSVIVDNSKLSETTVTATESNTKNGFVTEPHQQNTTRSARLMGLVASSRAERPSSPFLKKKSENVQAKSPIVFSPKTDRVRKMMKHCEDKKAIICIVDSDDENKEKTLESDLLQFTKVVPSPLATPKGSILKRKRESFDLTSEDNTNHISKRKRVNFSDPLTTSKKVFIQHDDELVKKNRLIKKNILIDPPLTKTSAEGVNNDVIEEMELEIKEIEEAEEEVIINECVLEEEEKCKVDNDTDRESSLDKNGENLEVDTTQSLDKEHNADERNIVSPDENSNCVMLDDVFPIVPEMVDSTETRDTFVDSFFKRMNKDNLVKKLEEKDIKTVGDVAKLTERKVSDLFIEQVSMVKDAIKDLAKEKRNVESSDYVLINDENLRMNSDECDKEKMEIEIMESGKLNDGKILDTVPGKDDLQDVKQRLQILSNILLKSEATSETKSVVDDHYTVLKEVQKSCTCSIKEFIKSLHPLKEMERIITELPLTETNKQEIFHIIFDRWSTEEIWINFSNYFNKRLIPDKNL